MLKLNYGLHEARVGVGTGAGARTGLGMGLGLVTSCKAQLVLRYYTNRLGNLHAKSMQYTRFF